MIGTIIIGTIIVAAACGFFAGWLAMPKVKAANEISEAFNRVAELQFGFLEQIKTLQADADKTTTAKALAGKVYSNMVNDAIITEARKNGIKDIETAPKTERTVWDPLQGQEIVLSANATWVHNCIVADMRVNPRNYYGAIDWSELSDEEFQKRERQLIRSASSTVAESLLKPPPNSRNYRLTASMNDVKWDSVPDSQLNDILERIRDERNRRVTSGQSANEPDR